MFRTSRHQRHPTLDLHTVRETVSYMHDDAARTPGCERLAIAFGAVLREIDAAAGRVGEAPAGEIVAARFLPFRRPGKATDHSA